MTTSMCAVSIGGSAVAAFRAGARDPDVASVHSESERAVLSASPDEPDGERVTCNNVPVARAVANRAGAGIATACFRSEVVRLNGLDSPPLRNLGGCDIPVDAEGNASNLMNR